MFLMHRLIVNLLGDVFQAGDDICHLLYYTLSGVTIWFKGRCTSFSNIF